MSLALSLLALITSVTCDGSYINRNHQRRTPHGLISSPSERPGDFSLPPVILLHVCLHFLSHKHLYLSIRVTNIPTSHYIHPASAQAYGRPPVGMPMPMGMPPRGMPMPGMGPPGMPGMAPPPPGMMMGGPPRGPPGMPMGFPPRG